MKTGQSTNPDGPILTVMCPQPGCRHRVAWVYQDAASELRLVLSMYPNDGTTGRLARTRRPQENYLRDMPLVTGQPLAIEYSVEGQWEHSPEMAALLAIEGAVIVPMVTCPNKHTSTIERTDLDGWVLEAKESNKTTRKTAHPR